MPIEPNEIEREQSQSVAVRDMELSEPETKAIEALREWTAAQSDPAFRAFLRWRDDLRFGADLPADERENYLEGHDGGGTLAAQYTETEKGLLSTAWDACDDFLTARTARLKKERGD